MKRLFENTLGSKADSYAKQDLAFFSARIYKKMKIKILDKAPKISWEDFSYEISKKWTSFAYLFRKPYYKLILFKRFMKIPYYGPWEMCNPIMEYPFEIFCEFYEQCDQKNYEPVEEDKFMPGHATFQNENHEEMHRLYKWWTIEKPQSENEIDELLDLWGQHHTSWLESDEGGFFLTWKSQETQYSEYIYKLMIEEEKKFDNKTEDMLFRLMKLRNVLCS